MKDLVVVDWRAWIGFGIDGWFDLGSNFVSVCHIGCVRLI